MKYIPALDGVRGLCVLAVILSHYEIFKGGGWLGVEIFFVLSGFLISAILLRQREAPVGIFLRDFYIRRGLRILPAYVLGLLVIAAVGHVFVQLAPSRGDWWSLASYTYNLRQVGETLRASALFQSASYTHFWSLCVEEQFYLIWPLVIYYVPRERLRLLLVVIVAADPLLRGWLAYSWSAFASSAAVGWAIQVAPWSHLDAFAWGALLACTEITPHRAWRWCLGAVSLFAGLGAINLLLYRWLWPSPLMGMTSLGYQPMLLGSGISVWGYTAIQLLGTGVIALAVAHPPGWLQARPLIFTGRISYGIYIFHAPILAAFVAGLQFAPESARGLVLLPLFLAVVLGFSALSYYGIEQRFLRLKHRFSATAAQTKAATTA